MNYTETYRKIYSLFSSLGIDHEAINKASLRITNAIHDIYAYTQRQAPELVDQVASIVEEFSSNIKKVGSYDLDDKDKFDGPTVN